MVGAHNAIFLAAKKIVEIYNKDEKKKLGIYINYNN